MGAAIQLLVSTVTYRPPLPSPAIRWHTDDPSPYFFPRIAGGCPVWQLKCAVYLTDVDRENMGNFVAAPGSHRDGLPRVAPEHAKALAKGEYRDVADIGSAVPGAVQVTARAGDVLIFHPGLWHTVARNTSSQIRKNLWFVYGPLWMRLGDRLTSSPELVQRSSAVRRQLLGATTGPHRSALAPGDEGAPLVRLWEGRGYDATWQHNLDGLLKGWWQEK
jgi:ectoine hydroxylase-related dioxygenase (phytanoyl-CoA dioxygenase family)